MTKQPSAPTIRANVLTGIVLELRNQGAPVDRLLRKHVGNTCGFADPYEQIPLARFVGFLEDAAQALGTLCWARNWARDLCRRNSVQSD